MRRVVPTTCSSRSGTYPRVSTAWKLMRLLPLVPGLAFVASPLAAQTAASISQSVAVGPVDTLPANTVTYTITVSGPFGGNTVVTDVLPKNTVCNRCPSNCVENRALVGADTERTIVCSLTSTPASVVLYSTVPTVTSPNLVA